VGWAVQIDPHHNQETIENKDGNLVSSYHCSFDMVCLAAKYHSSFQPEKFNPSSALNLERRLYQVIRIRRHSLITLMAGSLVQKFVCFPSTPLVPKYKMF
jgi:hypothetical protein